MSDVRETLRALTRKDRWGAVWCTCLCASTVRHLMEPAALPALRLAWLCSQGVPVSKTLLQSASEFTPPEDVRSDSAGVATYGRAPALASLMRFSARDRLYVVVATDISAHVAHVADLISDAARVRLAGDHVAHVVDLVAHVLPGLHADGIHYLGELVDHQLRPIVPTGAPERPEVAVVWDHAAADAGPTREGSLGDALARARRWRLRWWVPHERAIAERLAELPAWAHAALGSAGLGPGGSPSAILIPPAS